MAILADMKGFYRWLDEASDEELSTRRDIARVALRNGEVTDRDLSSEAKRLVRLIEEEMINRKLKMN